MFSDPGNPSSGNRILINGNSIFMALVSCFVEIVSRSFRSERQDLLMKKKYFLRKTKQLRLWKPDWLRLQVPLLEENNLILFLFLPARINLTPSSSLCVYLSFFLSVCTVAFSFCWWPLSKNVFAPASLFVCPCLSLSVSIRFSLTLCFYLYLRLGISPPLSRKVCVCVCISLCLCVSPSLFFAAFEKRRVRSFGGDRGSGLTRPLLHPILMRPPRHWQVRLQHSLPVLNLSTLR